MNLLAKILSYLNWFRFFFNVLEKNEKEKLPFRKFLVVVSFFMLWVKYPFLSSELGRSLRFCFLNIYQLSRCLLTLSASKIEVADLYNFTLCRSYGFMCHQFLLWHQRGCNSGSSKCGCTYNWPWQVISL